MFIALILFDLVFIVSIEIWDVFVCAGTYWHINLNVFLCSCVFTILRKPSSFCHTHQFYPHPASSVANHQLVFVHLMHCLIKLNWLLQQFRPRVYYFL